MGALKKIFLSFAAALIVLVVVFIVFLKLFLPSQLLRDYVSARIAYVTGGRVELKEISFGLNGFTLSGLSARCRVCLG